MLQSMRDRLTGPIVWFIVGLICIPFAFWGIQSFNSGGADPVVAKVGHQKITQQEFQNAYRRQYQQLQGLMGENFRPEMIDPNRFRESVLKQLVQESLLSQRAGDAGYRASNAALFDYLSSVPAFQDNGRFSAETYKHLLARQGMQTTEFERQMRQSLAIDQLRQSVVETAFVTDKDAYQSFRLAQQTRELGVAQFPVSKYMAVVQITDEQVAQRYEAHKSRYMSPERIKLAYLELDLDKLPKAATPGPDVLKVIYDAEKDALFASQEERRARHILVSFGADKAAAKAKIEGIAQQLAGGADFAALARSNSDDAGSKAEGGDLGWVRRGMMVKPFEDALFALQAGATSAPVESEFGWHLIRLDDLKPAQIQPFEAPEVQARLLEIYQSRETEKRFQEQSEKLEQLAFENPTSLDVAARELGLAIQTTDWFSREGGAGLAGVEAVRQAAFSPEVLTDNENSTPLAVGEGRVAVVRKSEYEATRQRPLEEVSDAIRTELKAEAAKARAQADAAELIVLVKGGQPLEAAAVAKGATLGFKGALHRNDTTVDSAITAAAFRMPHPQAGTPAVSQLVLASGDVAVIALTAVNDPPPASTAAEGMQRDAAQLRDSLGGAEFSAYSKDIEKKLKVDIKQLPPDAAGPESPES